MALIEGCRHELEVTVSVLDIADETSRVLAKIQKQANVPGFRPGKAPLSIIQNRFRTEVRQEVIESLIPKALNKRFEEEHLQVVGTPNIVDLKLEDGQPLVFKAQFDVHPEFETKEYKGLEVEYEDPTVEDKDLDDRISQLRESKAEYVNLDPRAAESGDFAVVALESIAGVEGEPVKSNEMMIELGNPDTMAAFTEGIVGMVPGESKQITVDYPEDYGQAQLAGKSVTFDLELKFLRRKELPELDDDFAQSMGDFKTLDEFREQVKASILAERTYRAQEAAKSQLLEKLADAHDFPVPETYIERQLESQLRNYAQTLAMQGIDPQSLNLDYKKFSESQRDRAIRDVKASLLVDRIAGLESVSVLEEEVDREVQRIARSQREPVAAVRLKLEKEGGLERIANRIRTDKTINFLFEQARKVAPQKQPEPQE
ncbi:MAG: trigger factor [Bryobacter sp.]